MASRTNHLRLVATPRSPVVNACRSQGCEFQAAGATGLCGPCFAVHATAEVLYRRLVARDMARLERRAPGIGGAALAALHEQLARLDPPIAAPGDGCALALSDWMPEEWELHRLEEFVAELRGSGDGGAA